MNVRISEVEGTSALLLYEHVCMAAGIKNMKLLLRYVLQNNTPTFCFIMIANKHMETGV
jgi:hypothetical protein